MRFAREMMELMAPYPGRDWRMRQLVNYICNGRPIGREERNAMREAIRLVMEAFEESGAIHIKPSKEARGGFALYCWKVPDRHVAECKQ